VRKPAHSTPANGRYGTAVSAASRDEQRSGRLGLEGRAEDRRVDSKRRADQVP
jgi:hypothetical protein